MSTSWKGGSTRAWRKLRALVLEHNRIHNGGRCTLQISGVCTGRADTVHHALGRQVTGDDPRYLQATCTPCNLHVGQPPLTPQPKRVSSW